GMKRDEMVQALGVFFTVATLALSINLTASGLLSASTALPGAIAMGCFEKKLAALKGREAIPGITLNWDRVEVSGFPFRMDANFQNLSVSGAGAHGPFFWRSEKFAMHGLSYGRSQDVYEAAGKQQVGWTGPHGEPRSAIFMAGSIRASSILDAQGLRRFDLDIVTIRAEAFAMDRLQFHLRRDPGGSDLDLMAKIDILQTRGTKPGNLQFYAALKQAHALYALLDGETSWPRAAAAWRAQGGTAKLSQTVMTGGMAPQTLLSALY
ncbi:MAG TPA: DUF2125 domain-containing protein, partial [Rhizomicrobium sp.]|nr:DUF2125 domain-containing protein [Rhizomicrobium sp.]